MTNSGVSWGKIGVITPFARSSSMYPSSHFSSSGPNFMGLLVIGVRLLTSSLY